MNTILEDYKQSVEAILAAYDSLTNEGFIPCNVEDKTIEAKDIAEQKKLIKEESFVLSVCGQINAGKSTLLNYLLFNGEDVLPTDDTPWTAKLAKIKYGEDNFGTVYFYSKEQWKELKSAKVYDELENTNVNYFEKYLKEELNNCARQGIYEQEVILDTAFEKRIDDLSCLEAYVAKKGKYTPFVAYIELTINNPFIKDLIIVDTPGLNDPNIYRSQITKNWIDKSNAIIYLMHAEEPLGICDYNFIDKYLSVIPSERIVFALSRIDNEMDYRRAKNYVETQLKNSKGLKQRNLLQDSEVYPISTMAAIIRTKMDNKIPLKDEEEFYYQKMTSELLNNQGFIPKFVEGIESHLMKNKGDAIIKAAQNKILYYGQAKLDELKYYIKQKEEKVNNLGLSRAEISNKQENIKDTREKLQYIKEEYQEEGKNIIADIDYNIGQRTTTIETEIKADFETWINSVEFDQATALTSYTLNTILKTKLQVIFSELVEKKTKEKLDDLQDDIKNKIKEITKESLSSRWNYVFNPVISFSDILDKINEGFASLKENALDNLRDRIWYIKTDQKKSKARIVNAVGTAIDNFIQQELRQRIKTTLNTEIKEFIKKIFSNVEKILNDLDKQLKDINGSIKDKDEEAQCVQKEIELLSKEKRLKEQKFSKIIKSMEI